MRKNILTLGILIIGATASFGQDLEVKGNVDINKGEGFGLRFWWGNPSLKIDAGQSTNYFYGPVSSTSIKFNALSNSGAGWTWGKQGVKPVFAVSNVGKAQIADDFTFKKNIILSNDDEDAKGIKFLDADAPSQVARISFDSGLQQLNFYIEGSTSESSSDVLMQMVPTREVLINGTLKVKEIFVQTNVWADYVFDKDYELKSLYEVEQFIDENKHLPGIPTEEEVQEEGVNVANMNVLLLEKVEELTLHMIQFRKELDELKK
ncbi:MAG: hypothetical protein COB15_16445 [Flavobacteriales bacterium]|nr:MAG: hypothetical protein COB15_16445 [Flavobacteriales bacterium]